MYVRNGSYFTGWVLVGVVVTMMMYIVTLLGHLCGLVSIVSVLFVQRCLFLGPMQARPSRQPSPRFSKILSKFYFFI